MERPGYLMRLAYELGYSNAVLFTRGPLRFYALDEINFKLAVPIGSVLRLKSRIAHTEMGNPFLVVSFALNTWGASGMTPPSHPLACSCRSQCGRPGNWNRKDHERVPVYMGFKRATPDSVCRSTNL